MLRAYFFPKSLSLRVFWLIAGVILLVEFLAAMPGLGRERQNWLWNRVAVAQLTAFYAAQDRRDANPGIRAAALRLTGAVAIPLDGGQNDNQLLPKPISLQFGADISLNHESLPASMWRADLAVLGGGAPYSRVYVSAPSPARSRFEIVVSQARLAAHLRSYVARKAFMAATLAMITGGLVFVALDREMVRPLRIMTASIAGFRRSPNFAGLAGLQFLSLRREDEIAKAAQELAAMQSELRTALWRNARLAALGTSVAKISHDLRNILSSALLVADRFQRQGDPAAKQTADALIPAMERAVELVGRTVDFAQAGPPEINRAPVLLHALVNEVADVLRAGDGMIAISNMVPFDLQLSLDRNQIYRVLANLMHNAVEAGATTITLATENDGNTVLLVITDNGPGLPSKVMSNLFQPFSSSGRNGSSGLGLAIARDLIRAHGGDLLLRRTGPEGAAFAMGFPCGPPEQAPDA